MPTCERHKKRNMKHFFTAAAATTLAFTMTVSLAGCGLFGSEEETTTELTTQELSTVQEFVDVIEMTDFTEPTVPTTQIPVTAPPTTTRRSTTTRTQTQPPQTQPTQPTQPTQTQPQTSETATQSTTKKVNGNGGTLNSAVISPINSGNYTMSVGITNDSSDVASKYKSGSSVAYRVAFPSNGFDCYVFEQDGNYYLTGLDKGVSKYCTLTSDQYNSLTGSIEKAFSYNFGALTYKDSTVELHDGSLQTREEYERADGSTTYLWFKNGSLSSVLDNADTAQASDSVKISVSSGSGSGIFSLPSDYVEDTEKNLATACIPMIQMVCG